MTDLGTLGGAESGAYDINEAGQIVGWAETAEGEEHATFWHDGTTFDVDTSESLALGINQSGQIVGRVQAADAVTHAVMWQPVGSTNLVEPSPAEATPAPAIPTDPLESTSKPLA
jgi:probable HAF family extracellular repeat protein